MGPSKPKISQLDTSSQKPIKNKHKRLNSGRNRSQYNSDRSSGVILTSGNGLGLWCHAKKEAPPAPVETLLLWPYWSSPSEEAR